MKCSSCGKESAVTVEIEAAPPLKVTSTMDKALPAQMAEEGRGAAAGPGFICSKCYRNKVD